MKQGKTRLFCVGENLLSVEVVLVALFWVSEPVTETLALGKGNLLRMLLPAQPEQAWDRGLLAIVVLVFACYVRRGLRAERQRIEGRCCFMAGITESSGSSSGAGTRAYRAPTAALWGVCCFSQFPTIYQPCSRQFGAEILKTALRRCGAREKAAGATSVQPFLRLEHETR